MRVPAPAPALHRLFLLGVATAGVISTLPAAAGATRTTRVDLGPGGAQAGRGSQPVAALSADGRQVLFSSDSRNLVPDQTGCFLRDRSAGATSFVGPFDLVAATPDLQVVAFLGSPTSLLGYPIRDVRVLDRGTSSEELVSVSHDGSPVIGDCDSPSLSDDGNSVAFTSQAENLVLGDTNHQQDVFVRDRGAGTTRRASLAHDGAQGNNLSLYGKISGNGRFVAFYSRASNLVPGGTNGKWHVFVRDLVAATTELVSVLPDASVVGSDYVSGGRLAISPDGRFVAFTSATADQTTYHLWLRDRLLGTTELVSQSSGGSPGNAEAHSPVLSSDGRYVAFASAASNLVAGDTNGAAQYTVDVFVRDRTTSSTTRVNLTDGGMQTDPGTISAPVSMVGDGSVIAFASDSSNLVAGDTNGSFDVFLRDDRCGNGAVDAGEDCDDANATDGDGCDSTCTVSGCGNGVVTAGEACDSGPANGTDSCCSATCALVDVDGDGSCDAFDDCLSPGPTRIRLSATGAATLDADDTVELRGSTTLPVGVPVIDAASTGAVVRFYDQLGNLMGGDVIPGGAGWQTSPTGRRWTWTRPSTTTPSGLSSLRIARGAGAGAGRVTFGAKGAGLLFSASNRPPIEEISVVLSFSALPGDPLACAQGRPTCSQRGPGGPIRCR